ncbi:uncharacterized protein N7446_002283 [Penicillium canescens]|uniref:DUF7730 domain-containing protein n=1 Tax=Penicillium canescens TaxID=5083 RepID=A0AAD6IDV5_PENCN|nr:uncharacterized protein N7446_002283 [Penicillium canescens]KAJ6044086.1 hypothetical protein N7460_005441 [Penicillium canescens]KAJ6055557.1 hypothetical protein N7444_004655 [Penicillium canescens]KAJ6074506.1 hypothetical protein N7446_002283 [Penicillium canescens]
MTRTKGVFSWEDVLAQRYQSNKPSPLPRTHPQIQCPQPQPQSRLLARLSPELRLMIWEYVLGGQRIHIIQRSRQRLGHVVCPVPLDVEASTSSPSASASASPSPSTHHTSRNTELYCEVCHGGGIPQPAKEADLARRKKSMLLGLALSCRLIYKESIQKLYTHPTLEFSNPWTASYMRPTIPPESWSSIRSVELRWSFPGHWLPSKDPVRAIYVSAGRAQWIETCAALRALSGLRRFVLVLGRTWFAEELGVLGVFLEPLFGLGVRDRTGRRVLVEEEDIFSDGSASSCSSDGEDWGWSLRSPSSRGSISSVSEGEVTDPSPFPSPLLHVLSPRLWLAL